MVYIISKDKRLKFQLELILVIPSKVWVILTMLLNCYFRPPCNSAMFQIWETLLQEVELDSQAHSDISASLARQVSLVYYNFSYKTGNANTMMMIEHCIEYRLSNMIYEYVFYKSIYQ